MANKLIKHLWYWIAFLLVLILFKKFIEDKVQEFIVETFLRDAEPSIFANWLWFFLIIGLFIFTGIKLFRGYIISNNLLIIILLINAIYSYYRWISNRFQFYNLKDLPQFYYFDIISFCLFCCLLLWFISFKSKKKGSEEFQYEAFIVDDPIENSNDDALERNDSAKEFAKRIIATNNTKALAIGINGNWGAGKTSYLNFIKEALPNNTIIVDFNPWRSLDSKSLIKDFFNTLSEKLKEYSSEFNDLAKVYSKLLVSNNGFNKLFNFTFLTKDVSIDEYYRRINVLLGKLRNYKRVVIFIDDLDRLDGEEIYEVLKLIRNTADFNNVSYVVAYDKTYINNIIEDRLKDSKRSYLEKIFQIEHNLPFLEKKFLLDILYKYLIKAFPSEKSLLDEKIISNKPFEDTISIGRFNNVREVKRFLNIFIYDFHKIKNEVDFVDFFNVKALYLKYPAVHEDLYKNSSFYFAEYKNTKGNYIVWNKEHKKKSVEKYFEDKKSELGINNTEEVLSMINTLFSTNIYSQIDKPQGISNQKIFYKYFKLSTKETDLSETEFKISRDLSFDDFQEKIKGWIKDGKRWDVIDKMKVIKYPSDLKNRKDLENIIKATFFIAYCNEDKGKTIFNGYPDEDIYDKIILGSRKEIIKKFYSNDFNAYKEFLLSVFRNAPMPFYHESLFIKYLFKNNLDINIPVDTLKEILKNYFVKAIEQSNSSYDNYEIYDLYHINIDWIDPKQTNEIFTAYLDNGFFKYFIKHIINIHTDHSNEDLDDPERIKYSISDIVLRIFENWNSFEVYINMKDKNDELNEFLDFYQKYKDNNYKPIKYKFIYLPIKPPMEEDKLDK